MEFTQSKFKLLLLVHSIDLKRSKVVFSLLPLFLIHFSDLSYVVVIVLTLHSV